MFGYLSSFLNEYLYQRRKNPPKQESMIQSLKQLFFLFAILSNLCLTAQAIDYKADLNKVNGPHIQTVLLNRTDIELSLPVIKMNTSDQLILRFDDLRGGVTNYSYTFELCTYDWKQSGLSPMEYLDGFEEQYIDDYSFSFNTQQRYTHYKAVFPNQYINFRQSGNYILRVWEEGNDTQAVITYPFYLWEEVALIDESVTRPNLSSFRDEYQRVNFNIDITDARTTNPYDEIKVFLMQNYRYDNARYDLKPRIVSANKMMYDQTDLLFHAGKEYRRFDTRSLRVQTDRIKKIEREAGKYNVFINADENRSYKRYFFENDINGRFLIAAELTNNTHLEADYSMINFALESPYWMTDGEYYVTGTFNQYRCNETNKMNYNFDDQLYECSIYLKQGYYNYMYAYIYKDSKTKNGYLEKDYAQAEGNYFEAVNDYSVFIYLRDNMRNTDKLIGYKTFSSLQN